MEGEPLQNESQSPMDVSAHQACSLALGQDIGTRQPGIAVEQQACRDDFTASGLTPAVAMACNVWKPVFSCWVLIYA